MFMAACLQVQLRKRESVCMCECECVCVCVCVVLVCNRRCSLLHTPFVVLLLPTCEYCCGVDLVGLHTLRALERPVDSAEPGMLSDLLWSDPDSSIVGWGENDRGTGFTFGPDVVESFLAQEGLSLICRAHQVCMQSDKGPVFVSLLSAGMRAHTFTHSHTHTHSHPLV